MKKILFLTFALIAFVNLTGQAQNSKPCTLEVRCSKLDSAQALIEKGKVCEVQLDLYKQIETSYKGLTRAYEAENSRLQDSILVGKSLIDEAVKEIEVKEIKIKRKNKKLAGSIGMNLLLLFLIL